jgi:NitT/TauT family transport system substrate-binding protein
MISRNSSRSVKTAVVSILSGILLLVGLIGCSQSIDEKKVNQPTASKFDIGMVTFAGYAPMYLAKEKGFFGDLNVELHRIEEVASIRAGMATGDLEAYLATPDIALDTNTKPPGVAVWALDESAGGDGIVVSGEIDNLQDLKGRKVAAEPGLPPNFILLYLLHKNGMRLKDVMFQDMTTQDASTAFVSKAIDAAGLYEPYLSVAKKQREGSKVVISSADAPGLIVDAIFVREDRIKSHPENVRAIIEGWRKAVRFIKESPDEANLIMAKAFNLPVNEFKDAVGGIRWLDLESNRKLFGTSDKPGPLYSNFSVVRDVLKRNRSEVYDAQAEQHITREFVAGAK